MHISTPFHLRRRVRKTLWRCGILLFLSDKDGSFVETCEKLHVSDLAIGKFLALNPDTTKLSPEEISKKIKVPIDIVEMMVRIQETPPDKRADLVKETWDD